MTIQEQLEALKEVRDAFYQLSLALVAICDIERCTYTFDYEYEIAKKYIEDYERNENV